MISKIKPNENKIEKKNKKYIKQNEKIYKTE